jgi:hypothetical protein
MSSTHHSKRTYFQIKTLCLLISTYSPPNCIWKQGEILKLFKWLISKNRCWKIYKKKNKIQQLFRYKIKVAILHHYKILRLMKYRYHLGILKLSPKHQEKVFVNFNKRQHNLVKKIWKWSKKEEQVFSVRTFFKILIQIL